MPGPVLTQASSVLCSHGGVATAVSPFPRVLVAGAPVVTLATQYAIAGCSLSTSSGPFDVSGQWVAGAVRVLAGGVPVAIATGSSLSIATGAPLIPGAVQPRVVAS
ncbi:hypothetical protein ACFVSU_17110 [Microbacterium sp. NPDC058062]|uniref:hypothetical protein n=1 Tax=Microbacterium sp. NPDC058062 TaxID=3346320 RepID=UPI0036DF82FB